MSHLKILYKFFKIFTELFYNKKNRNIVFTKILCYNTMRCTVAKVNIFKIDNAKKEDFINSLGERIVQKQVEIDNQTFSVVFMQNSNLGDSSISWNWLLKEYGLSNIMIQKQPKAILYVEVNNNIYAATFGSAYNQAEQKCDRNFAFNLARKFKYKKIKSTAQANPNSNKNKVITSYLDNEYFEYESGAAFLKIKSKLDIDEDFVLFGENIEIGTSIKLEVCNPSLYKFVQIIKYIDTKLLEDDVTPIPVFQLITNKEEIAKLDIKLKEKVEQNEFNVTFADFDIIGTTEMFYSQNAKYKICYDGKHKKVDTLDNDTLIQFCNEKGLVFSDVFLDLKVRTMDEENQGVWFSIKELIDCSIDDSRATLINGRWYKYNDDYIVNLTKSLLDLPCEHNHQFDFRDNLYQTYIDKQVECFKNDTKYSEMTISEIKNIVSRKYYNEKVYNILMQEYYNFVNGDRLLYRIDAQHKIELDDFYRENEIYAVKFGNSSNKLCYVVDQMTIAMNCIKRGIVEFPYNVKNVIIVLVIDKKEDYPVGDVPFDINKLNFLPLKNALNNWQKEARLLSFNPKVIVGYME
ncbi:MAG: hypothetical protein E7356_04995 [Clostridiales bacterium]|nr:hypothetical protein [Clostridiales bacterium]